MTKTENKLEQRKTNQFYSKLSKSIKDYGLIQCGDKIMVGVSGGKNSMSLLYGLAMRQKYYNEKFKLIAIHIDVENVLYSINSTYIKDFCNKHDIEFIIESIHIDFEKDPSKSHCFVCSWHRRKRLFELSEKHNCNKLALGHHQDDAIETLLINMCYHNCISSMPASLKMFNDKLELIRPLILLTNKEISEFAKIMNFPSEKAPCPWDDKTKRNQAKEIINEIEKRFKPARKSIYKAMSNIHAKYLPIEKGKNPIIEGINVYKENNNNL